MHVSLPSLKEFTDQSDNSYDIFNHANNVPSETSEKEDTQHNDKVKKREFEKIHAPLPFFLN